MPVSYVNRRGQTYYLKQRATKTGKVAYYFAMKSEGDLVEEIPDGFEVYESPNAQVFLRRIRPKVITDGEVEVVRVELAQFRHLRYHQVEVKGKAITVYGPDQDVEDFSSILNLISGVPGTVSGEDLLRFLTYSPEMRFVLVDEGERAFVAERYCFLGSVDDWIEISEAGGLDRLARTYIRHLGRDSFFELY
jgi:hypothetical protein